MRPKIANNIDLFYSRMEKVEEALTIKYLSHKLKGFVDICEDYQIPCCWFFEDNAIPRYKPVSAQHFKYVLGDLRRAAGLSRPQLEEAVWMPKGLLRRLEEGQNPYILDVIHIANYFNISVDFFLTPQSPSEIRAALS